MKKVIIKDIAKAEKYGFAKRHIIGSDDEFDLYELQIRGKDALYFFENSSNFSEMDGVLRRYSTVPPMELIAVATDMALKGILEVKDE